MKEVAIITDKFGMSFSKVARDLALAFSKYGVDVKVMDWRYIQVDKLPKNVIQFGALQYDVLNYASKIAGKRNMVLYLTAEGECETDFTLKKMINEHAHVLAVSNYVKRKIEEQGIKVDEVVYHGVDLSDKSIDEDWLNGLKSDIGDKVVFLNISENGIRKALDRLLFIYKMLHHVLLDSFLILHSYSDGFYKLRDIASNIQLKNFWITDLMTPELALTDKQINTLYYLASQSKGLYLVSSMSEGFCLPVIEAFKFGLPVVAPALPPIEEIVGDTKAGLLIPVTDVFKVPYMKRYKYEMHDYDIDMYVEAVLSIFFNRMWNEMHRDVLERVKHFDMYRNYGRIVEYFV